MMIPFRSPGRRAAQVANRNVEVARFFKAWGMDVVGKRSFA
jgi:hypothetical protein